MASVFIIAHGCYIPGSKINLGNDKFFYFKSAENTCAISDATQVDVNPSNYPFQVSGASTGPRGTPDYSLSFTDSTQDFGLNSFGIFTIQGANITRLMPNPVGNVQLSALVNHLSQANYKNFYLNVCRTPCGSSGGKNKKKKRKTKSRRNRKSRKQT